MSDILILMKCVEEVTYIILLSLNNILISYETIRQNCVLLERVGLLRFSQSDTETVVKTIREIEPRFSAFDEVKESKGKRDRARQEIFLHENRVFLEKYQYSFGLMQGPG